MKIIQNAFRVKNKILHSTHVHACRMTKVKTIAGKYQIFGIDGGLEYFRYTTNLEYKNIKQLLKETDFEDLRLTTDNSIEEIKNKLLWGTFGKNKDHELKWIKLINCETEHLQNIISTQEIPPLYKYIIDLILEERKNK